jgi:S-adenosyl methyltransferase
MVSSHARVLLNSDPAGKTDFIQADLRDTEAILSGAATTLDFGQPVAILLINILHFIPGRR